MRNPWVGHYGILLADDDDAVRQAFRELLGLEGFTTIFEADSGLKALEILQREMGRLAFSIMDVDMPGMTGIEVLRTIRMEFLRRHSDAARRAPSGTRAALPCIFITGDASRERQVQALEAGAFSLLRKPVAPDLLRYSVQRLLDHHYGKLP